MKCRLYAISQRYLLAALLVISPSLMASDQSPEFEWPNQAVAAVSLAYDDALASQLDHALPALNRHGFKASFYLTLASETLTSRQEEWRQAAAQGHELGNHTVFHPCSASLPGREWVAPARDLDRIPAELMMQEVKAANAFLQALDGRTQRTFTPPCLDRLAAGEDYVDTAKSLFVAIKGLGESPVANAATLDPWSVPTGFPSEVSGEYLIEQVKQAAIKGGLVSLTFHGIGGDYLAVTTSAHEELLQFLAENRDVFWTDTFLNIMLHVKAQNESREGD